MKRERPTQFIATCVMAIALHHLAGCTTSTPQPPPPDNRVNCSCRCEQSCSNDQVLFTYDIGGGISEARCRSTTPGYGGVVGDGSLIVLRSEVGCAAGGNLVAACQDRCPRVNTFLATDPVGKTSFAQNEVGPGNSLNCEFNAAIAPTLMSANSCDVTTFQQLTATSTNYDTATVLMQAVGSSVRLQSGESFFDLPTPPTGSIAFRGGNCPGQSCPAAIDMAVLRIAGFSDGETTIGDTVVMNDSPIVGTKAANGQLLFTPAALNATITTSVAGTPGISILAADAPMGGSYDPVTGQLQLSGTFTQAGTGESVTFTLGGQTTARPPIAKAGPDQTVACTAAGPATVAVNGSQTVDPDGGTVSFFWSRNGVRFASAAIASVALGSGSHDLVLAATDSTGLVAQDAVRITVTDPVGPTFTFVPPTVVVETTGAVNIGQALATDSCSGSATVTNNAPASFPIGRTVVTWTAIDPSGNRTTATQLVFVLPAIAASCPAGSHVILGTSNNDVLIGTSGNDCIIGFGGQDRIEGRGGNDTLLGGEGDDVILGGTGDDVIAGGGGQDNCSGEAGNDVVGGTGGDDVLSGGDGNDTLVGGDGQDRLNGDNGNDTLVGNAGDDLMNGGAGTDRCVADQGHDQLTACE